MHFCRARIAIADDPRNVYYANEHDPVSWPEIQVLQMVHGASAVDVVEPFASVHQSPRDERQRLAEKYREDVVKEVFAAQGPNEMEAPGVKIKPGLTWFNPISMQLEETVGSVNESDDKPELTRRRG